MRLRLLSSFAHLGVGKGKASFKESATSPVNAKFPSVHSPGLLRSIFSATAFFMLYSK